MVVTTVLLASNLNVCYGCVGSARGLILSNLTLERISRSKLLALSALLAGVSIILHPPFLPLAIPAPYLPFLIYGLWEIPLVVGLFLYGLRVGMVVTLVNFVTLVIFFPGELITGPIYNLTATYSMMFGIYLAHRGLGVQHGIKQWLTAGAGIVSRVGIMTVVNGFALPLAPPIGFSLGVEALPSTLILVAIFNGSLAAYTIPIAHKISTSVIARIGRSA